MAAVLQQASSRVLVVEDEAIVALDLKAELESMGHEVCGLADTADRALALARRAPPDLALVDIRLKGATDGITLAGVLRQELQVPVVYLTSYSDDENVRRATQTMPFGYLTKPFQAGELRAAIAIALHNAAMERRLRASELRFRNAFDHAPLGMAPCVAGRRALPRDECRHAAAGGRRRSRARLVGTRRPEHRRRTATRA